MGSTEPRRLADVGTHLRAFRGVRHDTGISVADFDAVPAPRGLKRGLVHQGANHERLWAIDHAGDARAGHKQVAPCLAGVDPPAVGPVATPSSTTVTATATTLVIECQVSRAALPQAVGGVARTGNHLALQVQRSLKVMSDTFTHVLVDKREVDPRRTPRAGRRFGLYLATVGGW
jgi:hypothetical protein